MMKRKIIYSILTLLIGCSSFAQLAVTNTGILYITGSSDIFCAASDFSNHSGSALTNNGQLHVKGHLINDQSSMAIGTGTLYIDGTSAQIVAGAQTFKTYHLNTNNSTGITLNNNLSVSGTHTFTSGIITTSATPNYLIYEAGSSYSGDGDTKHVNGWVKKFGSTNFIFPVGNATLERTIAMTSLSASSEFNTKYFPATTPNNGQLQPPVWAVNQNEYWTINQISGGTAILTLNWDYNKVYFPNWIVSDILVTGYNGSLWINKGGAGTATGTATTTGSVTSTAVSSFNTLFAIGSRSYALPLTLISFTATRPGDYTQLTWITEKEYNSSHFVVERSDDGISFYAIAQLPARNSGVIEQYNTRDNAAIRHIAYYRLRSIDINGRENLSKTIAVMVNDDKRLTLLVNPVHEKIMLLASPALNGTFNYSVTAMNGQLIQQGKLQIQNGGSYQIYLKNYLTAGLYTLDVSNGSESFRYKLIVQ
jgi:hypothetical protein